MALKAYMHHNLTEAGCDEAGRGCLAGPVVAAAVILPKSFDHPVLNDSKTLTEKQRNKLKIEIIESAIDWKVAFIDNHEIDEINILKASIKAMHIAINCLEIKPEMLLIDGNTFYPYNGINHKTIIKGDGIFFSIAAASILAKTFRDEFMMKIHNEFPHYEWNKNKGYPTASHRKAILQHGTSPYHRKSFRLIDQQMKFEYINHNS